MDEIIGVDVSRAFKGFLSGTEYYSKEITRSVLEAGNDKYKFRLYSNKPIGNTFGKLSSKIESRIIPFPRFWTQLRLSFEIVTHKPSVLFVPAHTIPLICPTKTVVTVHDLGFMHYPELYRPIERFMHKYIMSYAIKKATKIVAISQATKDDILKFYPKIDASKIRIVYQGLNHKRFRPVKPTDDLKYRKQYGKYILFVGRIEERKNIARMIEAFALLKKERGVDHKLVLAGRPRYGYNRFMEIIDKLPSNIQKDIILPGYISDNDLPILLREADIFLYPSLFEGFGLPILEAYASGVPVVTSNVTSMPEVAGKAALIVNPYKTLEIASALSQIIHKPKLRDDLIYAGKKRALKFNWEITGQQTLEIILDALKKK